MDIKEADEIIADYMDRTLITRGFYRFLISTVDSSDFDAPYSRSLNELIPVWEKLDTRFSVYIDRGLYVIDWNPCIDVKMVEMREKGNCLKKIATIITAKVIKRLSDENI